MDMRGQSQPIRAMVLQPHRCHPKSMRGCKIAFCIFEHRAMLWSDADAGDDGTIGARCGLGGEANGPYVAYGVKALRDAELLQHARGIMCAIVRKNGALARQAGQRRLQLWSACQRRDIHIVDEGKIDPRKLVAVHEFARPGIVLQRDDVRVTSFRVRHPPITQSYAYRFDTRERSVVISGDTAYAPELARFAKDADVLIHEAMYLPAIENLIKQNPDSKRLREHLLASHTSTEDVGRIAAQAGVKIVVLSHLVPGDDPSITDEQWAEGVRKHFAGKVIVGKDLMEI